MDKNKFLDRLKQITKKESVDLYDQIRAITFKQNEDLLLGKAVYCILIGGPFDGDKNFIYVTYGTPNNKEILRPIGTVFKNGERISWAKYVWDSQFRGDGQLIFKFDGTLQKEIVWKRKIK